ncbi:MAG: hypothetical protein GY729_15215, partial [Desulfobacteraceae bacterium]|nr:hypothetical protein [Desulfobacteraceae bacterium]
KPVENFDPKPEDLSDLELQRYVCAFSKAICDIDFAYNGEDIGEILAQICTQYKKIFDLSATNAYKLLNISWSKILKHASILKVQINNKQ